MVIWPNYNSVQAEEDFEGLIQQPFSDETLKLTKEFYPLRQSLLSSRDKIYEEHQFDTKELDRYIFDLEFGLELFEILHSNFNFSNRDASNDDIWRFLSIKVIPDIVHSRWGLRAERYYKMSRRIWLKQIYWYILLGWQGSKADTYQILKNNTTDTIMNIVERPGRGYNIKLFREILRQYAEHEDDNRELLRRVLVYNTALNKSLSPELIDGGISEYVSKLFERVI